MVVQRKSSARASPYRPIFRQVVTAHYTFIMERTKDMKEKAQKENSHNSMILVAWVAMLLPSSLTLIIWRQFGSEEPYWWFLVPAIGLLVILTLTLIRSNFKPLRGFVLILLAIFLLGYGAGWQSGLAPFVRSSSVWIGLTSIAPWIDFIAPHLLRLIPALAVISILLLRGRKRSDFFLVKGNIRAPVEPSKLLGMKKPEPWTRIGTIFAVIFSIGTLAYLILTTSYSLGTFALALPLIPIAVLIAAVNAFNEEFTLRAAPLSELWTAIGKKQGLLITTVYFALGHFYGVPSGVLGILLSGFLGWFLGKSLLETKGFFWAWTIHFVQDAFIFSFFAMSIA